jgi:hypothetical protein
MAKIFALEAIRTMTKGAAGMSIGSDAFLLCCVIVTQQDSIQYRRPVSNWNHTLCDILGFNQKQLFRARDRAIEAGWLQYTPGRKSVAGSYMVTIPEHARDCDGTICEEVSDDSGNNKGTMCPQSGNNVSTMREQCVHNAGTMRETFIPIPNPNPIPIPNTNTRAHDGDLFPPGPPTNGTRPDLADDETKWRYEGHMWPWAQEIKKATSKIGPKNWTQWKTIHDGLFKGDTKALTEFITGMSADKRWPDDIQTEYSKRRPDAVAELNGRKVHYL